MLTLPLIPPPWILLAGLLLPAVARPAAPPAPGQEAALLYNSRVPESRRIAQHYAERRGVPYDNVIGLPLATSETVTRQEFTEEIQNPLLRELERRQLLEFTSDIVPSTNGQPGDVRRRVTAASIRYLVLCYGVPVRILKDAQLKEEGQEKLRAELQRNEAAVDSELALLPRAGQPLPLYGPLRNPFYGVTNRSLLHPTNGILLVARLDGPSPETATSLLDKALEAERDGLWGRAYFDSRGLTNGPYALGDEWMRKSAEIARRTGFETVLDSRPETFGPGFPLSHVALYAGWYDGHVSGPFLPPKVEFMPGAFAYHLHSFSAHRLRTEHQHWTGPLLARGATVSLGCVDEPYLEGTPDIAMFLLRWIGAGFTFGEAAYAAQGSLSWQTTVVGDPLYRPFAKQPAEQHAELEARQLPLIEWSVLKLVNMNLAQGDPPAKWIDLLEKEPLTARSAILQEKLADLCQASGKIGDAIDYYEATLRLNPSPQQKMRLLLSLPRLLVNFRREQDGLNMFQAFLLEFPDYPDRLGYFQQLASLATDAGDTNELARARREIEALTPKPPPQK